MQILWKYDKNLGIAYFCPHCKTFLCTGSGACSKCGGDIEWNKSEQYKGNVKWD